MSWHVEHGWPPSHCEHGTCQRVPEWFIERVCHHTRDLRVRHGLQATETRFLLRSCCRAELARSESPARDGVEGAWGCSSAMTD